MTPKEQRISFKSKDGVTLRGILTTPGEKAKEAVIFAHGITGEKDEGGLYAKLSRLFAGKGVESLRFDFRGHGESGGKPWTVTIKGELDDLAAAVDLVRARGYEKVAIIGFSFGGGITVLYAGRKPRNVSCITLLCPVLDYRKTFLEPETAEAAKWFSPEAIARAKRTGRLDLAGFPLGHGLLKELSRYKPGQTLLKLEVPCLIIHGTDDNMVPYTVARYYGRKYEKGEFLSVKRASHSFKGFEGRIAPTITNWVLKWI